MKKFIIGLVASLLIATPVLAEVNAAPVIGTDEYCWSINYGVPLAERHDSYFNGVTPQNPTGCFFRYNVAWHEKNQESIYITPQNVPYVNDYTSRTLRVTDLWGSPEELTAKLCSPSVVTVRTSCAETTCSVHIPAIMRIGRKDKYVQALQEAAVKVGLMSKPQEWGRVDQATAEVFAELLK